ncbi:jmjC domain-containing protein 4, partial [Clarias magur]
MDRETFGACSSLVKLERQPCAQLQPSHCLHYIQTEIPYSQFYSKHLLPNRPCMFSSAFTQNWSCRSRWVGPDAKPDFHALLQEFDETPVPVADCSTKEYNSNPKHTMSFRDFISYWRDYIQNGHSSPKGCLYLKDWHMQ